ncbi:MAG: hypothetical protein RL223_2704 [Pseudomonadota bacterium]
MPGDRPGGTRDAGPQVRPGSPCRACRPGRKDPHGRLGPAAPGADRLLRPGGAERAGLWRRLPRACRRHRPGPRGLPRRQRPAGALAGPPPLHRAGDRLRPGQHLPGHLAGLARRPAALGRAGLRLGREAPADARGPAARARAGPWQGGRGRRRHAGRHIGHHTGRPIRPRCGRHPGHPPERHPGCRPPGHRPRPICTC